MQFEHGDPDRPRGHALLFFRDREDPQRVLATYLVVPPIVMDLAKYVPPMLAAQLPGGMPAIPNVYPLPPFPEQVESLALLRAMAERRGDDLIDGGSIWTNDLQRLVMAVSEAGERYAARYLETSARLADEEDPALESAALDVDDILFEVMTPAERVGRLSRSLGTLRYAVLGGDTQLIRDTVADMRKVGRRLEPKYKVDELLAAAQQQGSLGDRLSTLYVERCYRLAAEDYAAVADIERQIADAREHPADAGELAVAAG